MPKAWLTFYRIGENSNEVLSQRLHGDEVEFAELGDDITLTTTVDGHNIMAHAWGDKVRKCFVSTHSTTIPGRPSNKRRWREVLDEDGEEIGQSEVLNKTVKRKKVVETYFDAASIIDINNHMRQGGVALETAWQTQSWASRVISTILGIVETDAYLLYKKFHPGGSKISHSDFTESVAKGLLIRRIPELYHLLCWHNEDAVSVVANSAVNKLSEGGVGCSVKWGKKLYYSNVVASGRILYYGSGADDEVSSDAETPSQPVPATTSQPVPASNNFPACTSHCICLTSHTNKVPITLLVIVTTTPPPSPYWPPSPAYPSDTNVVREDFAPETVWSIVGDSLYDRMFCKSCWQLWCNVIMLCLLPSMSYQEPFCHSNSEFHLVLKEIESPDLFERTLLPTISCGEE
ncbi:hypothetical protein EMCRGX_G008685 [Ephydatia muelleri]